MELENKSIVQFQETINLNLDEIDIKNNDILSSITNINNNLEESATDIFLTLVSTSAASIMNDDTNVSFGNLSDRILKSGKDILLMADQAEQFICVSNATFSRVIDIFLHLNKREFEIDFKIDLENIILRQDELNNYLVSRVNNSTENEAIETQTEATQLNNIIISLMDDYIIKFTNVVQLFQDALNTLVIFQSILKVNTTVGISLAVTKPAWDELKIMSMLNYSSIITVDDEIILSDETGDIFSNSLLPDYNSYDNFMLKRIPFLILGDYEISVPGFIYKSINDQDVSPEILDIDSSFGVLSVSEINDIPRKEPSALHPIFGDIAFTEQLDTTVNTLTVYYESLDSPGITLNEFLNTFTSDNYLKILSKYVGGLSSAVLSEYIKSYHKYNQYLMLKEICNEHKVVADMTFNDDMVVDGSLFDSSSDRHPDFSVYVTNYIKEQYDVYKLSPEYATSVIAYNDLYHSNNSSELILQHKSGYISVREYTDDDSLIKVFKKYKYAYKIYKDDLYIYHGEFQIGDHKMVIKNNKVVLSYNIKTEKNYDVENIETSSRDIVLELLLDSYLINDFSINSMTLNTYNEHTNLIIETKIDGIKNDSDIVITSSGTSPCTITKTINNENTVTSYISNDPIERITTNITNIYRDELLASKMDFSQARINSIISSLRFLKYREQLETFIDKTWDMSIPHPSRG